MNSNIAKINAGEMVTSAKFKEQVRLEEFIAENRGELLEQKVLGEVESPRGRFPIYGLRIGKRDNAENKPCLGLFAGMHGLENIGTHLLLYYFESLFERLKWDETLNLLLEKANIVSIPIINPVGMAMRTRSNGRGVDLNRNSPVEAKGQVPFLAGGHRWGPWLPWYQGTKGKLEKESKILVDFVKDEAFKCPFLFSLDIHSGFGVRDFLWYPYAKSKERFTWDLECGLFRKLLKKAHPNHIYKVESQSHSYTTHGDLWDHIFQKHSRFQKGAEEKRIFIPWTLEMGSWSWIRKNPTNLFTAHGFFNPTKEHRYRRTMRRHQSLLEFFLKSVVFWQKWLKK